MVSNKTLALFIILTVIVSLGGTLLSLNKLQELSQIKLIPTKEVTGLASGEVNLVISTNMSCTIDSNISFGSSGKPASTITISTNKNNIAIPSNFSDCTSVAGCMGMMVNNSGNVDIFVNFSSNVDGSGLVGGAASDFQYIAYNGTTTSTENGCRGGLPAAWANVPTTATAICTNLTSSSANNMMTIEYNITIGPDTIPGAKTATITVNCGQA